MRTLVITVVSLLIGIGTYGQNNGLKPILDETDQFLRGVVDNGLVDYTAIKKNKEGLNSLLKKYGIASTKEYSSAEKKAFYINAYNLFVINGLIESYPISSSQKVPGFFDSKKHLVGGELLTLNAIEKERLSPQNDPRLHFVLVCGALSCPVLEPFAYQVSQLEAQLDQQVRKAINDDSFIMVKKEGEQVAVSKIFSWYKTDFTKKEQSILAFINKYRNEKIPNNYKLKFYDYNWGINDQSFDQRSVETAEEEKSNLQTFTPSALFSKGQYEVNVFNSIYSQKAVRNANGDEVNLGGQTQSFFNSMIQFTTGVSKSSRFNIGFDINIVSAKYSSKEESALGVFNGDSKVFQKTILSTVGPRIKFNPFRSIPRLSVQSTFLIPIAKNQESPNFIAHDRYTWFTQLFYDQSIGEDFQLFLETDFLYRINRNSTKNGNFFRVPLSGFFSYFPNSKSTLFVFSQYSPRFETVSNSEESEFGLSQWFTQVGVGAKYQLTKQIGLELSYADFALSRNDGAGYNLNFGLKYIYR